MESRVTWTRLTASKPTLQRPQLMCTSNLPLIHARSHRSIHNLCCAPHPAGAPCCPRGFCSSAQGHRCLQQSANCAAGLAVPTDRAAAAGARRQSAHRGTALRGRRGPHIAQGKSLPAVYLLVMVGWRPERGRKEVINQLKVGACKADSDFWRCHVTFVVEDTGESYGSPTDIIITSSVPLSAGAVRVHVSARVGCHVFDITYTFEIRWQTTAAAAAPQPSGRSSSCLPLPTFISNHYPQAMPQTPT